MIIATINFGQLLREAYTETIISKFEFIDILVIALRSVRGADSIVEIALISLVILNPSD